MLLIARPLNFILALTGIVLIIAAACVGSHAWASHHLHEGERLVGRQEYAQAYQHFVTALKVWRRSPETELQAGRTARRAMLYTEAEPHFQRCLSLAGTDKKMSGTVALERLLVQVQKGDVIGNEIILWQKVKENDPESQLILEAMWAAGRLDDADAMVDRILERDPDNAFALAEKGALLAATGHLSEGEAMLRRAVERDPFDVDAQWKLYSCLSRQKGREVEADAQLKIHDRVKAERDRLTQILNVEMSKSPEDPNLSYEVGMIYYRRGYTKAARRWWENALKFDPGHQPAYQALFELLKKEGDQAAGENLRGANGSK